MANKKIDPDFEITSTPIQAALNDQLSNQNIVDTDQLKAVFGLDGKDEPKGASINMDSKDEPIVASQNKTEQLLTGYNIKQGSPTFAAFGLDFLQKYDRLQKLKGVNKSHAKYDNSEIIELDNYLANIIIKYFAPVLENQKEGKIKEVLETISALQKILKTQAGLVLKCIDDNLSFMALGANGAPVVIPDSGPLQYSIDYLAGESDIINNENVKNIFKSLTDTSNLPTTGFSFTFKLNAQNNVYVQLFINGTMDVVFGYKSIEQWLNL